MKVSARWTEAAVCRTASAILVHPLARQPSIKALRMAASTCGVLLRDDDEPPHILALREELAVLLDRRLAQRHPVRASLRDALLDGNAVRAVRPGCRSA